MVLEILKRTVGLRSIMSNYEYGDVSRYQPRKLTEKILAKARTGLYAGNPAHMILMVREIDRLRAKVEDFEEDFRNVVAENCAGDEKHCSCVPHLRRKIEELEESKKNANLE